MHHFPHLQQQLTEASVSAKEIENNVVMIILHLLQKNNYYFAVIGGRGRGRGREREREEGITKRRIDPC